MMQHEIVTAGPLLNEKGNLREPGWARRMLLSYDRGAIQAGKLKIKEWDYYLVNDQRYGIALTIADNGYMSLISASLLDFENAWEHTQTVMGVLPMGKLRLPPTSVVGDVAYADKRVKMRFENAQGTRRLWCEFQDFCDKKPLKLDILLEEPHMDSMVIATPFEKPGHFYYNQKINCMPASGCATWNNIEIRFNSKEAFGTLDWGRGVWTYDNTWYWGSGNGWIHDKPFGFNIGYGFGDTSRATENVIHYDGKAHKLADVAFHIPKDGYLQPWAFTSSDERFTMAFTPVLDRAAHMNVLVLESDQHQVFGYFNGVARLDDGTELVVKDVLGFAEKVRNRY